MALKTYTYVPSDPTEPTGGIIVREYDHDEVRQSPENENFSEKRPHRITTIAHGGYNYSSALEIRAYYNAVGISPNTTYQVDISHDIAGMYSVSVTQDELISNGWTPVIIP
jgi:hypothetical protein